MIEAAFAPGGVVPVAVADIDRWATPLLQPPAAEPEPAAVSPASVDWRASGAVQLVGTALNQVIGAPNIGKLVKSVLGEECLGLDAVLARYMRVPLAQEGTHCIDAVARGEVGAWLLLVILAAGLALDVLTCAAVHRLDVTRVSELPGGLRGVLSSVTAFS